MRPKKRLGQHFLINVHAAKRIAESLDLSASDHVLEIGPGRGDLTVHLLATGANVTVVEFDKDMIAHLELRFADAANLRILQSDILEFDTVHLDAKHEYKLAGNLPYNITSPILEWIITNRSKFPGAVIMVQKEVAERIAAVPGNKDFGSLTIFVQLFYDARRVFDVSPGSFNPAPKVASTVLKLDRRKQQRIDDNDFPALRRLTSACFRWRRKQLIRILREEYSHDQHALEKVLQSLDIAPNLRPEQLPVDAFVRLAVLLKELA